MLDVQALKKTRAAISWEVRKGGRQSVVWFLSKCQAGAVGIRIDNCIEYGDVGVMIGSNRNQDASRKREGGREK